MQVVLTPQAEKALRQELARSPGRQPEDVVEQALTELSGRAVAAPALDRGTTPEDFRAWLAELRRGTRPATHLEKETFSRQMIYQSATSRACKCMPPALPLS